MELFGDAPLRVLDLGCGSGIIAVMLGLQRPTWQITGIDVQAPLIELARENAAVNRLDTSFLCMDLKEYHDPGGFDLIVGNPPWLKLGAGIASPDASRELSRREIRCTAEDVMACLKRNLRPDGTALLVYPSQRLEELRALARNYLLDIFEAMPTAETNKYLIYHIRTGDKA